MSGAHQVTKTASEIEVWGLLNKLRYATEAFQDARFGRPIGFDAYRYGEEDIRRRGYFEAREAVELYIGALQALALGAKP